MTALLALLGLSYFGLWRSGKLRYHSLLTLCVTIRQNFLYSTLEIRVRNEQHHKPTPLYPIKRSHPKNESPDLLCCQQTK
jgi:hypothetical protein